MRDLADIESTVPATPAQRLAWLEEMLELAYRARAIGPPRSTSTKR